MSDSHQIHPELTARKVRSIAKKLRLVIPDCSSNHLTPTLNAGIQDEFQRFLDHQFAVSDKMAVIKRKFLKSRSGYPYRPARLVPLDQDIKKEWYIVFYVWDLAKQKIVRKRVFKSQLQDITNKKNRLEFAQSKIYEINQCLHMDMHAEGTPEKKIPGFDFKGYSILDAIEYAKNYKKEIEGLKGSTLKQYDKIKTCVTDFLKFRKLPISYKLRLLNGDFINTFFPYLKEERNINNKTFNHYRTTFHAVIQVLIKKDPKLFINGNPIADVKFLKTESRKHAAYSADQLNKIQQSITASGDNQLLLFIRFMFYTLARPKELEALKVGHILLKERRILFLSESAKTSIEEYIGISDHFAELIEKSGILKHPTNHYIFTPDKIPGTTPVGKNYFYKRIHKHLDRLGVYDINPNHTLYSFKHSGAISLYQATKDIKLLQAQCRHQNIEQTNNYLRDLGLFRNFDLLNSWAGPL